MREHGGAFANNEAGLAHALERTLHLRKFGNKTRLVPQVIAGFTVLFIEYTPAPRPNRAARGCAIGESHVISHD